MKRMKKFFYGLLALTLVIGCEDSSSQIEPTNTITQEKLIGTWVVKVIDGELNYTNEYFVCRFNADNTQDYVALSVDGTSTTLVQKEGVSYTVKDNVIYLLNETDDIQLKGAILTGSIDGEEGDILSYTELRNIDGGEDMYRDCSYSGIRCDVDYSEDILGVWEGTALASDLSVPFQNIKMKYYRNGLFDFYYLDENGEWIQIGDNDGIFCIMGNMLYTQWDETDYTAAEGWETIIDGDTMTWRARRDGNPEAGFDLVRITDDSDI